MKPYHCKACGRMGCRRGLAGVLEGAAPPPGVQCSVEGGAAASREGGRGRGNERRQQTSRNRSQPAMNGERGRALSRRRGEGEGQGQGGGARGAGTVLLRGWQQRMGRGLQPRPAGG